MPELITQITVNSAKPKSKPYDIRDTRLSGFILRVSPAGRKMYYVQWARGKRKLIGRADLLTPTQARQEAKTILGQAASGQDLATKPAEKMTLKTFIDEKYGPWAEANRKDGAATVERLHACFSDLMTKKLSEITAWNIEGWRSKRLKAGIRPATVNRDIAALKSTLSKAVEWGLLPMHPLSSVKPMRLDSKAKVRYLTKDEEARLRAVLNAKRGHAPALLKPLVLLALNTGMRRGEMFHLTWSNVDFTNKTITVVGDKAKSGSTRHIPMNAEVVEVLEAWQKISESDLVFPGKQGKPLNNTKRSWATALEAAKIESFRFHDLRHTFASNLVMAGVDLNTVRDLLGHADLKMTLRYAHLAPEHKAAAVELLGGG